jgi:hypothetical protein
VAVLPQFRSPGARAAPRALPARLAGPAILVVSIGWRYGLGFAACGSCSSLTGSVTSSRSAS